MGGETKLEALLEGMQPDLASGIFVFATLPHGKAIPPGLDPVLVFREREGRTLVVLEDEAAAAGLAGTFRCRMITLAIHSSLEAVGFLAAITARLGEAGMGVNPVSGFYHDHLFVPAERAEEAFAILQDMAARRDMARK